MLGSSCISWYVLFIRAKVRADIPEFLTTFHVSCTYEIKLVEHDKGLG